MKTKVDKGYLARLQQRYQRAARHEKQVMLDELTKTAGYDRKYASKLLTGRYKHKVGKITRPRRQRYSHHDALVLKKVAELLAGINAKRLQPQIGIALNSLAKAGKLRLTTEQRQRLIDISPATIDRLLTHYQLRSGSHGRSYTKPGSLLKHQIPLRTFADWDEDTVGFCEVDLVGHDGGNSFGEFAFTLNVVDVKTQWSEQVAVRNKAQRQVFAAITAVQARLPFPLRGIDSDSGAEFINYHLYHYALRQHITFTRSRAGKKNDQAYVEQKNDSVVRFWVGYHRYDTSGQVAALNQFYELLRLYNNFFLPVQKLATKERIGSRVKKTYDHPQTPYQRILAAPEIANSVKQALKRQYASLDLVQLKQALDEALTKIELH